MSFNPPSLRNLSGFVGELTASVAGVQAALREVEHATQGMSGDVWATVAAKQGIKLNGVSSSELLVSSARLSLVSIYTGFDAYLSDLRKEYRFFYEKEWQEKSEDSPLSALKRNCPRKDLWEGNIDQNTIVTLDYYRAVRNSVVHPRANDTAKAFECYTKSAGAIDAVRTLYGMKTAPNDPSHMSFHDVKVLARLILDVARSINIAFNPPDDVLAKRLPNDKLFQNLKHDANRRVKSIAGFLRMEYGLTQERAVNIAQLAIGSLA